MQHALNKISAQGLSPVAIYGTGEHTRKVLTALLDSPVQIVAFVDDSPQRQGGRVCGWPVVGRSDLKRLGVKAVVINTDYYEATIWNRREEFESVGIRLFRLYPELVDSSDRRPAASNESGIAEVEARMSQQEPLSAEELRRYWASRGAPDSDDSNRLEDYFKPVLHSVLLADWIEQCGLPPEARILELGCNVGRNLAILRYREYTRLAAIEINRTAVKAMRDVYPETADTTDITIGALEHVLPTLNSDSYDMVFSSAVLTHVPTESEFIFDHIVRVSRRFVMTIEDEYGRGARHFRRDYGRLFTTLGCTQRRALRFREAGELTRLLDLDEAYVARLFEKLQV